jgi:ankyrin repeat protein
VRDLKYNEGNRKIQSKQQTVFFSPERSDHREPQTRRLLNIRFLISFDTLKMSALNGQQLYDACRARDFVRVRSLVSSGEASVNFRAAYGDTPAMACCRGEGTDILTYLIQRGANLDLADNYGLSTLHIAAIYKKHLSMVVLLRHGANAELTGYYGSTALMLSAQNNCRECITLLLQHGVAVNTVITQGRTALWYASSKGYLSIVELLVEGGSDIEIADNNGGKARDIARALHHTAIVEYLRTPLKDKRWQRRSGLAMVRSSIRDIEDRDRGPIIRALQCDDVAREIGSFL